MDRNQQITFVLGCVLPKSGNYVGPHFDDIIKWNDGSVVQTNGAFQPELRQ